MVIVDTSVWIDHFRTDNDILKELLTDAEVVCHPFVIGELACGNLKKRNEILTLLEALPSAPVVNEEEIRFFVEKNELMGKGIGLLDVYLLAASVISAIPLWTMDKRLRSAAKELDVAYDN